ncbi:MAG: hypothetical protein GEV05_14480 [Betaproteobacteria bacterium]|nr:hypothetical protein [Betaproteobacteria bacterium]
MSGAPAHNGVQAALLVAHGFTGVADVFSGPRNFFFAFSPENGKPAELVRGLGKSYEIMNASIKKWPVGAPILAVLDAIDTLRSESPFEVSEVERVTVKIGDKESLVVDNRAMPDICMQHCVAVMLLDGNVTFNASHDFKRMRDPRVLKLRKRVDLIGSPELNDPKRRWHAHVEIRLKGGRSLAHYTFAARGSSYNPMSRDEENAKALDLLAPVLGARRAQGLIAAVWDIEKAHNVRELQKFYRV